MQPIDTLTDQIFNSKNETFKTLVCFEEIGS